MSSLIANAVNVIRSQTTGIVSDYAQENPYRFVIKREDFHAWLVREERRTSCTFYFYTTGNAFYKNKEFFYRFGPHDPTNPNPRPGFGLSPDEKREMDEKKAEEGVSDDDEYEEVNGSGTTTAGVKRGRKKETNYNGVRWHLRFVMKTSLRHTEWICRPLYATEEATQLVKTTCHAIVQR